MLTFKFWNVNSHFCEIRKNEDKIFNFPKFTKMKVNYPHYPKIRKNKESNLHICEIRKSDGRSLAGTP